MPQELHIAPAGLFTDPSDETAPPGGLLTAHNVVIRRKGMLQPRPGFDYGKALDMTSVSSAYRLVPYDGDMVAHTNNGSYWYSNKDEIEDESNANLSLIDSENLRAAESRGNLYMPFTDGIRKVTAALDDEAGKAGAPPGGVLLVWTEAAGVAVLDTKVVRYRALIKREDANGNVLRGTPTGSVIYYNDSGGTKNLNLYYYFTTEEDAGDVIELYRTAAFAAATIPDDTCQLVQQYAITSADVSNGYAYLTDANEPTELGATIYTAPSRAGALQENARPPIAYDLAEFKGSMMYARTTGPQRVILEVDQANDADQSTDDTGIGLRLATGDTTSGSAAIANVVPVNGLEVGQYISGTGIPANSFIVTVVGATVTISANCTATNNGTALTINDVFVIGADGTNYTAYKIGSGTVWNIAGIINTTAVAYTGGTGGTQKAGRAISEQPSDTFPGIKGSLAVDSVNLGESVWYVWGTHGEAYFPALEPPTYSAGLVFDVADGVESDPTSRPNGITWSKRDQPEHVPEINYALVGSEAHPIQRIIPTRDALFIFKTDGIWRLTGAGERSGWRIDEFEPGTRLLRPDCAVEMDSIIYAWTEMGAVAVSDSGVMKLSASAVGVDFKAAELALAYSATTTSGVFVVANPKDNEVIFARPRGGAAGELSDMLYVFNTKTLAWYTWRPPSETGEGGAWAYAHVTINPADGKLYVLTDNAAESTYVERTAADYTDAADRDWSITIVTASGTSIAKAPADVWTPAVGDIVVQSSVVYIVTAVADADNFTVDNSGLTAAAAVAYDAFQSDVEFVAKTAGNPSLVKHYHSGAYVFADFSGIERQTYKWTSSLSTTATSMTETFTRTTDDISRTCRFPVPTAHARVTHLYPEIEIKQAGATWELTALSLWFEPMDERGVDH